MRGVFFRVGFLLVPIATAAWIGCSSDDQATPGADAGTDSLPSPPPPAPPPPPPSDAGVDAAPPRDCTADLDTDGVPRHLDCTGLYSDFASKTVAADAKPYRPGVEFWSDGAEKSRFLLVPAGQTIDTSNFAEWKFPAGTKAWKEFRLGGKRVETRLYWKIDMSAWKHVVYRWNDTETEAVRLEAGEKIPQDGGPDYEIPANNVCGSCHLGHDEPLLGVEAVNLGLPGATGQTLAALAAGSVLAPPPPATSFTLPDDGTTKATDALGWLHVNCGPCHTTNPNGAAAFTGLHFAVRPAQLLVDGGADAASLDAYGTAVCVNSLRTDDAGAPYKRIAGGDAGASLVSILSGSRAPNGVDPSPLTQMPPLVSHAVDTVGHGKLDQWIAALPPCP
jgi:hypothetical protein